MDLAIVMVDNWLLASLSFVFVDKGPQLRQDLVAINLSVNRALVKNEALVETLNVNSSLHHHDAVFPETRRQTIVVIFFTKQSGYPDVARRSNAKRSFICVNNRRQLVVCPIAKLVGPRQTSLSLALREKGFFECHTATITILLKASSYHPA